MGIGVGHPGKAAPDGVSAITTDVELAPAMYIISMPSDEQDRRLKQMRKINSAFTKIGHEPNLFVFSDLQKGGENCNDETNYSSEHSSNEKSPEVHCIVFVSSHPFGPWQNHKLWRN